MTAHLAVEVKQGVERRRQPPRAGLVVPGQRRHQPVPAPLHQTAYHLPQLRPRGIDAVELVERLGGAAFEHMLQQRIEQARVRDPQQRPRAVKGDGTRRQRHQLVKQPNRIAHRPLRRASNQLHRLGIDQHFFGRCDVREPRDDLLFAVPAEHELLAAPDHSQWNLLGVGGAEHEHDVSRRLLQCFQQRVERGLGEHVSLVDDVNLERPQRGGEVHLLAQVANLIDSAVRRGIDLDEVERRTRRHLHARLALVARLCGITGTAGAVQRLGQQTSRRGLARTAAAAEQVGVRDPAADDCALQRARCGVLADEVGERLRSVLSVKALVFRHKQICGRAPPLRSKCPSSHRGSQLRPE